MEKQIATIQYITQDSDRYSHAEQALMMYKNGIKWVQLRMKDKDENEVFSEAKKALEYAKEYDAILIINDTINVAREIGAHGVHLGLQDTQVDVARAYLGDKSIIGGTANTFQDVCLQVKRGADYIGVGPFSYTLTKKNLSPVIGLVGYQEIRAQMNEKGITTPLLAVGGVGLDDLKPIQSIGLHGVAISSALLKKYGG